MTLQLRQGKISGEMFVCDLDSMTCTAGTISERELEQHPDLEDYNLDGDMDQADLDSSIVMIVRTLETIPEVR